MPGLATPSPAGSCATVALTCAHQASRSSDVVIIRENEEDLYAGSEHQQTAEVVQCTDKLISRPLSEKIVRYGFEYLRQYGQAQSS